MRQVAVAPAAAPVPAPLALPVPSGRAIAYQRGLERRGGHRVLVERWVLPGVAFRERVTADGLLVADRSDGRAVDYARGTWRPGPVAGLADDCARTVGQVERGLADGRITVLGDGVAIGGEPTSVLRDHQTPVVNLWVIPGTGQVVRCRGAEPESIAFDLVWLPTTEVNLAQLVAVIPDGFVAERSRAAA